MKITKCLMAGAVLALAAAAANAAGSTDKNEAKLAKMLEGRTAGEPISCIPAVKGNRLEVLEGVGMVYKSGDTIYVAKPTHPEDLRDDILVVERFGSQLCNTDVVRTIDRTGG